MGWVVHLWLFSPNMYATARTAPTVLLSILWYHSGSIWVVQFWWLLVIVVVGGSSRARIALLHGLYLFFIFFSIFFFMRRAKCKRASVSKNTTSDASQRRAAGVCVIKPQGAIKTNKNKDIRPGGGGRRTRNQPFETTGRSLEIGKNNSLTHNAGIIMSRYSLLLGRNW